MCYKAPPLVDGVLRHKREVLATVIDDTLAVTGGISNWIVDGSASEVDQVLTFFALGIDELDRQINDVLSGSGVSVGFAGIFAHQSPYVNFDPPTHSDRCELADLCVIVTYNGMLGSPLSKGLGNGLFLQAKKRLGWGKSSVVQRHLYEHTTEFCYDPAPAGTTRKLPPKNKPALAYWELNPAAHHALVPAYASGIVPASEVIRTPSVRTRRRFGEAVVDLMIGRKGEDEEIGFGFEKSPRPGSDRWTQIIFDLIDKTVRTATVSKHSLGVTGASRGAGSLSLLAHHTLPSNARPWIIRNSLEECVGEFGPAYRGLVGTMRRRNTALMNEETFARYLKANGAPDLIPSRFKDLPPKLPVPPKTPPGKRTSQTGDGEGSGNILFINIRSDKEPRGETAKGT